MPSPVHQLVHVDPFGLEEAGLFACELATRAALVPRPPRYFMKAAERGVGEPEPAVEAIVLELR